MSWKETVKVHVTSLNNYDAAAYAPFKWRNLMNSRISIYPYRRKYWLQNI